MLRKRVKQFGSTLDSQGASKLASEKQAIESITKNPDELCSKKPVVLGTYCPEIMSESRVKYEAGFKPVWLVRKKVEEKECETNFSSVYSDDEMAHSDLSFEFLAQKGISEVTKNWFKTLALLLKRFLVRVFGVEFTIKN